MCTQFLISANDKPSLTLGTLYAVEFHIKFLFILTLVHLFVLLSLATPSLLYILLPAACLCLLQYCLFNLILRPFFHDTMMKAFHFCFDRNLILALAS